MSKPGHTRYTHIDDAIKRLLEYAPLEGTEVGERWLCLAELAERGEDGFSALFWRVLSEEVRVAAEETHLFKIVEERVTTTHRSLEWQGSHPAGHFNASH